MPISDWRDVVFDGQRIRGVSSVGGPFEAAIGEVIAVGEHVSYDGSMDWWSYSTSFLTRAEYGVVNEFYENFNSAAPITVAEGNGFAPIPRVGWPDWNNGTTADSRFIYPPWVYGFPICEWVFNREPSSLWDRLTGAAVDDWFEPSFDQTVRWLLAQPEDISERKKCWEQFVAAPPRPGKLGRRRSSYHWRPSKWLRRLRNLITWLAPLPMLLVLAHYHAAPAGWVGVAVIAAPIALAWLPQLFAATSLYDEGLRARTWFFRRDQCFYDDIATIEEEEDRLGITMRDGSLLMTTRRGDQSGGFKNAIQHRRLFSLSKRYAERCGIPFRSPDLKYRVP